MKLTKKQKDEFHILLAKLDWIQILHKAIESRRTSWGCHDPKCFVVTEWRNASDCVYFQVAQALREKGMLIDYLTDAQRKFGTKSKVLCDKCETTETAITLDGKLEYVNHKAGCPIFQNQTTTGR